jgi:hypothetical protein
VKPTFVLLALAATVAGVVATLTPELIVVCADNCTDGTARERSA